MMGSGEVHNTRFSIAAFSEDFHEAQF